MWSGKEGSISSVKIQKDRQGGWGRINFTSHHLNINLIAKVASWEKNL